MAFMEHDLLLGINLSEASIEIEITLRHGCSPVNLLHIFRTPLSGCLNLSDFSANGLTEETAVAKL